MCSLLYNGTLLLRSVNVLYYINTTGSHRPGAPPQSCVIWVTDEERDHDGLHQQQGRQGGQAGLHVRQVRRAWHGEAERGPGLVLG